jgi:hypothetical protein
LEDGGSVETIVARKPLSPTWNNTVSFVEEILYLLQRRHEETMGATVRISFYS